MLDVDTWIILHFYNVFICRGCYLLLRREINDMSSSSTARARELSIVLTVATARAHRRVLRSFVLRIATGQLAKCTFAIASSPLPVTIAGRTSRVFPGLLSESLKIPSQGISLSAVKLSASHRCFIEREMPYA